MTMENSPSSISPVFSCVQCLTVWFAMFSLSYCKTATEEREEIAFYSRRPLFWVKRLFCKLFSNLDSFFPLRCPILHTLILTSWITLKFLYINKRVCKETNALVTDLRALTCRFMDIFNMGNSVVYKIIDFFDRSPFPSTWNTLCDFFFTIIFVLLFHIL